MNFYRLLLQRPYIAGLQQLRHPFDVERFREVETLPGATAPTGQQ